MRINLKCPYEEKDLAKSLGARWDIARKVWYIVDVEDLTPFMRWIASESRLKPSFDSPPNQIRLERRVEKRKKAKSRKNSKKSSSQSEHHGVNNLAPVITTSAPAYDCGCDHVLPWEHCEHTERAAQSAMREMLSIA
jgi:hypothetical protein